MVKSRIPETDHGIQGEAIVAHYDRFMRWMKERGNLQTPHIIAAGIRTGRVLEVGPGCGYLGLEWLQSTQETTLTALEISPDMIRMAERNAATYGLQNRVSYIQGNALAMPIEDRVFDAVFSNGSLHEWADPVKVLNEIERVLKPDGLFYISDLHREIHPVLRWVIKQSVQPKEMRPGFITSINASYTAAELHALMRQTRLQNYRIDKHAVGIAIIGKK